MLLDRRHFVVALASLAALRGIGSIIPARADGDSGRDREDDEDRDRVRRKRSRKDDDDDDHGAAARARASGEILPLTEIIEHVSKLHPGEIVGIELERDSGQWLYEMKIVTPENQLIEIYVDARDKRVVKIEGK